jgi:hypothetical protein
LNTYAVIHARTNVHGATFQAWLTSEAGRQAIDSFMINGEPAYGSWPAGCSGVEPGDIPCGIKSPWTPTS